MSPPIDEEKGLRFATVERICMEWIESLIEHHGEEKVSRVLGSPAIQAALIGDLHQFGDQQIEGAP